MALSLQGSGGCGNVSRKAVLVTLQKVQANLYPCHTPQSPGGPGSLSPLIRLETEPLAQGLPLESLLALWLHTMEASGRRNAFPFCGGLLEKGAGAQRGFEFNANEVLVL